MEENFYKDEFEKFLQEQANNHRMYPTDTVWRNIHTRLHDDKNWPALTIVAITFLAAIIAISVHFSPRPNIFAIKTAPIPPSGKKTSSTPLLSSVTNEHKDDAKKWSNTEKAIIEDILDNEESVAPTVTVQKVVPAATERSTRAAEVILSRTIASKKAAPITSKQITDNIVNASIDTITNSTAGNSTAGLEQTTAEESKPAITSNETKVPYEEILKQNEDDYLKQGTADFASLNDSKKKTSNKRFSYNVYITPSKSFRRLSEDPGMYQDQNNGPVALNYVADVNKVVRHTPGVGVEAGVMFGYNLTKRFKVISGLQMNIRQYEMDAFLSHTEVITVALRTANGTENMTAYSPYRTSSVGNSPTELLNRYYQVSMPVGMEYKVVGSKNISLNLAGSIQPTYMLNYNSYVITTNFKNYTTSEGLMRRWNVNTNIEAFLKLKSGDFHWQFGPQFRYQQLPTFIKAYPIKEYLMDYGFKIGVSKVIQ